MSTLKVEGAPDIVRDISTRALLNVNEDGLRAYRQNRIRNQKINETIETVGALKGDIVEIKQMLAQLVG